MLTSILFVVLVGAPIGMWWWRERRVSNPALQWPVLAPILKLEFDPGPPPRLAGTFNNREVSIEDAGAQALITAPLSRPTRLRLEIGPRDAVTKRAGMVGPDPVATGDAAFEARFLARCSDRAAGLAIVDPVLRERLLALPHVELLGEGESVDWVVPAVRDADAVEPVLELATTIASQLERYA